MILVENRKKHHAYSGRGSVRHFKQTLQERKQLVTHNKYLKVY